MASLRVLGATARSVSLHAPRSARTYATAAERLKLSLVLPHQSLFTSTEVTQVNIPAATGDMGILARHEPVIEALRPGVVEVKQVDGTSKKWFVSGGFATMHPKNALTINAVEAAPLEDFSVEAVKANLAEAQRVASGNGTEKEKVAAQIEIGVYQALQYALKA